MDAKGLDDDQTQRMLLEHLVPPTLVLGRDNRVRFVHGDVRPFVDELPLEPWWELAAKLHPELLTATLESLEQCRRTQRRVVRRCFRQGTGHVQISASPAVAEEPVWLVSFQRDASELGADAAPWDEAPLSNDDLLTRSRRLELAWEAARGGILEHRVPLDASTYVSEQWAQVLGYRVAELPPYEQLLDWLTAQAHPDDREFFVRTYGEVLDGRAERYSIELRFRHRAGHFIWVRKIAKALARGPDGRVCHMLRMMIDITDLKEVEGSLKESESRFREMADGLPLMVWVHNADGEQELVNETFCQFFGVPRANMRGANWQSLLHPADADTYLQEFQSSLRERRPFHAETRVRHSDGTYRLVESWAQPRFSPSGDFRGMVGTSSDITARRQMEEILRESEARFRNLADNISQFAWMGDADGWVFWYNQRWYEYTGTTLEQVQGWGWQAVLHPEHVDSVVEKVQSCFEAGEFWEDLVLLRSSSGEYRWFLTRAIPIRDDNGRVVRWIGTNTDVTQLREVEAKLMEADRLKDEFLAMLGHELRNPLAAIRSAAEVLKPQGADNPRVQRSLQVLERQTIHMSKLLDGLLDVSRIIRGKIKLDLETVNLCAICREVVEDLASKAKRAQVELRADIPETPLWLQGDSVRLAQIVDNLLSNAFKYTPAGGTVYLTVRAEHRLAQLVIRDTGVGISGDFLPHVFETFRQFEQPLDRSWGGLGLGLSLVKTLAELHHGTVEAESLGEGQGATFTVRFPLTSQLPDELPPSQLAARQASLRVLLIEDNLDTSEMLGELLQLWGHQVSVAHDGRSGIDRALEERPDVIICDLALPADMSGYQVAQTLRAHPELTSTRMIAASGYGRPEDKRRSLDAGFDLHLTKPLDFMGLQQALTHCARDLAHARA